MKETVLNPNGKSAVRVAIVALVIGGGWVAALNLVHLSDPPEVLRLVPVAWLMISFYGLMLGLQAALANIHRYLGLLGMLVCLANIPLAAIFALAAMMGISQWNGW